jgi:O-antigen/teichoic acid export membrane protein
MLPVLTRLLTPEDYGVLAIFQVLVGVIVPFVGLSVHGAITRRYYDQEDIDFPNYVWNALVIVGATTLFVSVVAWGFGQQLEYLTQFPAEWMLAVPLVAFGTVLMSIVLSIWQVEERPKPYVGLSVSNTFLEITIAIFLIAGVGMAWEGRVTSRLGASLAFGLGAVIVLRMKGLLRTGLSIQHLRHLLDFGVPLIPHAIGLWAISMTDRLIVSHVVGLEQTGVYVVAVQLSMVLTMFVAGFSSAWTPWFYAALKSPTPEKKITIVRVTYVFVFTLFALAVGLSIAAPWFIAFFLSESFVEATNFLLSLLLGAAFFGVYRIAVGYIFFLEHTRIVAVITAGTALINVVASYVLVLKIGAVGAAVGTLVAYAITGIITWGVAAKLYPMPWVSAVTWRK